MAAADDPSSTYTYTETKLLIPFPSASHRQHDIVGILAQRRPRSADATAEQDLAPTPTSASPTPPPPRPLALIMHGVLAHKDQSYHKLLARSLPLDSFRFDFRSNGETERSAAEARGAPPQHASAEHVPVPVPDWDMAKFERDEEDIDAVLSHLFAAYGYALDLLVGHSRGSLVGWGWLARRYGRFPGLAPAPGPTPTPTPTPAPVPSWLPAAPPLWVSLGGRWRMSRIHDRDGVYAAQFAQQGFYTWQVKVAGQPVAVRITPQQVADFAAHDIAGRVGAFPAGADCLLIHGTADATVPVSDAGYYLNALTARADRAAGQTQVHLVEEGDHMFMGKYDEVVGVVMQWYASRRARTEAGAGEGALAEERAEVGMLERAWREGRHAAQAHLNASAGADAGKGETDRERL